VTALSLMRLIPMPPGRIVKGAIMFDGQDVLKMDDDEVRGIRGNNIAMIFQDPMTSLNPVLTISRQISEALELHLKMDRSEARKRTIELFELVGIRSAKKPYTWGLLRSIPRLDEHRKSKLLPIEGLPPDLIAPPPGCRFEPRCQYRRDICREQEPELKHIPNAKADHEARCWGTQEGGW